MPAARARAAPCSGCSSAARLVAVREEEDRDERARRAAALRGGEACARRRASSAARRPYPAIWQPDPDGGAIASPIAVPPKPRKSPASRRPPGRRGRGRSSAASRPPPRPRRGRGRRARACGTLSRNVCDRAAAPRRAGSASRRRLHRAGDVEHEDHRRLVARDESDVTCGRDDARRRASRARARKTPVAS